MHCLDVDDGNVVVRFTACGHRCGAAFFVIADVLLCEDTLLVQMIK